MSRVDARAAWAVICDNTWCAEMTRYEVTYNVDDGADIETAALEEHHYKAMRVVDDYLFDEVD